MIKYIFEWESEEKTGKFSVIGTSDEECVKIGHEEAENFGVEIVDYWCEYIEY